MPIKKTEPMTIWGDFDVRHFDADCPVCKAPAYPSEMCLEELPDYLILYHVCKSCGDTFETVYGLNRVE